MIQVPYDRRLDPPAPMLPLAVSLPASASRLQLVGLVDTGADITVIPEDLAKQHLPVAGTVPVCGVTGTVEHTILYRAEIHVEGARRVLTVAGFGQETIVGRDLLRTMIVHLDGPAQQMTVRPAA